MQTILLKEFRQYTPLVSAMLLLCLLLQGGTFLATYFGQPQPAIYLAVAIFATILYAGAAAAVSFAAEHDDKTFFFLRRLPVSVTEIMYGKSVWIIVSTLIMLAGSLVLTIFWQLTAFEALDLGTPELWAMLGTGIIEALVWGLFWSPRCRSSLNALLATYICASLESYFSAVLFAQNTFGHDAYFHAVPLRLGICVFVAVFAVKGMLRWYQTSDNVSGSFANESKKESPIRLTAANLTLTGQQDRNIRKPFAALAIHSFRQSFAVLPLGLAASLLFIVLCCFLSLIVITNEGFLYLGQAFLFIFLICYYLFYCGSIFAADQRNGQYRLLSRFGVPPRTVWFSRILPAAAVLLLPFTACLCNVYFSVNTGEYLRQTHSWNALFFDRPVHFYSYLTCLWLVPFASGAFISIFVRNQMVSVALTGAASLLLIGWMFTACLLCGLNPLWTTVPVAAAMLLASYLRAADWLRENNSLKRLLTPMLPVFCVIAAVIAAVPPVRIYSVPYTPLSEIEALLERLNLPLHLSVQERRELFRQTEESLYQPLTDAEWEQKWKQRHIDYNNTRYEVNSRSAALKKDEAANTSVKEWTKKQLDYLHHLNIERETLSLYAERYRMVKTLYVPHGWQDAIWFQFNLYRYLPWEKERMLRRLNRQLKYDTLLFSPANRTNSNHLVIDWGNIYNLAEWENVKHKIQSNPDLMQILSIAREKNSSRVFDCDNLHDSTYSQIYYVTNSQMRLTILAIQCWYYDHGKTLPDSLECLVGTYIEAVPTHIITGEKMQYYPFDQKMVEQNQGKRMNHWYHKPGWAYIGWKNCYTNAQLDLDFLPNYEEYGKD